VLWFQFSPRQKKERSYISNPLAFQNDVGLSAFLGLGWMGVLSVYISNIGSELAYSIGADDGNKVYTDEINEVWPQDDAIVSFHLSRRAV